MSTYLEQVREASFRGVRFQVDTHSVDGSVRGDIYELESTTKGRVLGLGARRHSISGFLFGDDVAAQSRSLRAALEIGQGVLVHPLLGELTVQIGTYSVSGTRNLLGRLAISFEAVEIDPSVYVPVVDEVLGVTIAAEALEASLLADFLAAFEVGADFADDVLDKAEAAVETALDAVESALSVVADARAAVARIAQIRADITSLLGAPEAFADAILGLFGDIEEAFNFGGPWEALAADPDAEYATPSEEQAAANQEAIRRLVVGCGIAHAIRLVPTITFPSWDAALSFRGHIVEFIEWVSEEAAPDVVAALADAGAALETVIASLAGELVPLRSITLVDSESALLLAYRLYGDPERADEIATQNNVTDPGCLLGSLQVATR